ncbi:MAG: T9SS type A sorting domain-containing protein [Ferruginibacter sp.]
MITFLRFKLKKTVALVTLFTLLTISCVHAQQIIITVAGTGISTFNGDGGPAINTNINWPSGLASDKLGNIYFTETYGYRIRKMDVDGNVTTVAGNGIHDHTGDGGLAINASIKSCDGIVIDSAGNIFFSEFDGNTIRKIDKFGIISTIAGPGTTFPDPNDGGPAINASIFGPEALALDRLGNLYIAEQGYHRIRKIDTNGIISTVGGNGTQGFSGDGGPATSASLWDPNGICVDDTGNIYFSDWGNNRIRKINTNGIISTIVGNGNLASSGDGGNALSAGINPVQLIRDSIGNMYISDNNSRVRKVTTNGIITTIAGTGVGGYNGDGIPATSARLGNFFGLYLDHSGSLYIADGSNHRIRKLVDAPAPLTMISFSARPLNENVQLVWETANEINTGHFVVERSSDGRSYADINFVHATGKESDRYQYNDYSATPGVNYYRLRCVDQDGKYTFSKVRKIVFAAKSEFLLAPNPAPAFTILNFQGVDEAKRIEVYDMNGKCLTKEYIKSSVSSFQLNTQNFANGKYIVRLTTAKKIYEQLLIVTK